jgi:hypothetical protein
MRSSSQAVRHELGQAAGGDGGLADRALDGAVVDLEAPVAEADVHVVGAACVAVQRERPAADEHEVDATVCECDEQIPKVVYQRRVKGAQGGRPPRATRLGAGAARRCRSARRDGV